MENNLIGRTHCRRYRETGHASARVSTVAPTSTNLAKA